MASSNASISIDLDTFRQAPGYYDDAYQYIKKSLNSLSSYDTYLGYSGFKKRTSAYNITYSSIYSSVNVASTNTLSISNYCSLVINEVNDFNANQNYTGATTNTTSNTVTNQDVAKATNAEVGEAKAEKGFWENVWGFLCDVGSAIKEFIEGLVATFLDLVASLLEGLCKLVEAIVDATVLLTATLVSWTCSAINWIFGTEIDTDAINNWTMSFIAKDFTGSVFHAFYTQTGFGQWMADNSILYGTGVRDVIVSAVPWIGIFVIGAVVTYFTGGTATPAYVTAMTTAMGAAYGMGSSAQSSYANGDSYYVGLAKGVANGAIGALQGYGIGKAAGAIGGALKGNHTRIILPNKTTRGAWRQVGLSKVKGTAGLASKIKWTTYGRYAVNGTFGMGKLAAGTAIIGSALGLKDNLLWQDGELMDFAKENNGNFDNQTEMCPTCGNPKKSCTCGNPGENETCPNCGKPKSSCTCGHSNEDEICPNCGKPKSSCTCGNPNEDETCPNCGKPKSSCTCGNSNEDETCPNCGKPKSLCTCGKPNEDDFNNDIDEPDSNLPNGSVNEEMCPNCGQPKKSCICNSGNNNDDDNGNKPGNVTQPDDDVPVDTPEDTDKDNQDDVIEEPNPEDNTDNENINPGDESDEPEDSNDGPNIEFVNVGPEWVEVTPTNPTINNNTGNVSGGIIQTPPVSGDTTGDVTFEEPDVNGSFVAKDDITYDFELKDPTVSVPDLDPNNSPIIESLNPVIEDVTGSVGNTMENVNVTSFEDLTTPGFDTSSLNASAFGLGAMGLGTAATSMYSSKEKENKKEKSEKVLYFDEEEKKEEV